MSVGGKFQAGVTERHMYRRRRVFFGVLYEVKNKKELLVWGSHPSVRALKLVNKLFVRFLWIWYNNLVKYLVQ